MKRSFLETICESCLISANLYKHVKNKNEFNKVKQFVVNDIVTVLENLFETDIEMYDKFMDKPKYTQVQIIENYIKMTYSNEEVLNELFGTLIMWTGFLYSLTVLMSKPVSKVTASIVSAIGSCMDRVGKFLSQQGKEFKLRYSIIYQNLNHCYIEAGIRPDEMSAFHYAAVSDDAVLPKMDIVAKKTDILKNCYLNALIETIGQLFKSYTLCLQKTGDLNTLSKISDDDILKVISGLKLSTVCKEYYNLIRETFENFNALLDLIYDNESKKSDAMDKLKKELIKSKENSFKMKFPNQDFNKPKPDFNKPKPDFNKPKPDFNQNKPQFKKY